MQKCRAHLLFVFLFLKGYLFALIVICYSENNFQLNMKEKSGCYLGSEGNFVTQWVL